MARYALYVEMAAKDGRHGDVENFLKQGAVMARDEPGIVAWYAFGEDNGRYGIFDTFNDEAGREAHLNGPIARALMSSADELLSEPPKIHKITLIAEL